LSWGGLLLQDVSYAQAIEAPLNLVETLDLPVTTSPGSDEEDQKHQKRHHFHYYAPDDSSIQPADLGLGLDLIVPLLLVLLLGNPHQISTQNLILTTFHQTQARIVNCLMKNYLSSLEE
jgi:hypothetical protein